MITTAEGVETEDQLRLVRKAGCQTVQGYLFGRPQPFANAVEHFGETRRHTPDDSEAAVLGMDLAVAAGSDVLFPPDAASS
jgi:predicted signal transduction protein with EAL and GGDEF domain